MIEIDTKVLDKAEGVEFDLKMNGERLQTIRYIYEEVDRQLIANMPDDILCNLSKLVIKELERRENNE